MTAPRVQSSADPPANARAVPEPQPISTRGDRRRSARRVRAARPTPNGPCRPTGRRQPALNPSYRGGLHLRIDRRSRAADLIQDRRPEPLRILLVAVDGDERDATNV